MDLARFYRSFIVHEGAPQGTQSGKDWGYEPEGHAESWISGEGARKVQENC